MDHAVRADQQQSRGLVYADRLVRHDATPVRNSHRLDLAASSTATASGALQALKMCPRRAVSGAQCDRRVTVAGEMIAGRAVMAFPWWYSLDD